MKTGKNVSNKKNHPDLTSFLKEHQGEKHAVVLQEFPDPDAIASGFAHQIICQSFNIRTAIFYWGRISHQQNIALINLLSLELVKYNESINFSSFNGAIFLDNQGTTTGPILSALEKENIPPLAVIDHHHPQNRLNPQYRDIRPRIGATSSIYAEYLANNIIEINKKDKSFVMLATALLHGIITDTNGFINAWEKDFQAAAFLSQYADSNILARIINQARSKQTMEIINRALGNRKIVENYSVAGVGFLRAEDRDAIPQAADFLLTEENVHTAIVYGIVSGENIDEAVIGSLRTYHLNIDPDQFIKEVFGKDASGKYFGGGKISAGGFHISTGFLSGGSFGKYRENKWQVFNEQVLQKIFAKVGIPPDVNEEDDQENFF